MRRSDGRACATCSTASARRAARSSSAVRRRSHSGRARSWMRHASRRRRPRHSGPLPRAALTRATGELLPGDRYADWASAPRERLTRRHLALLDLVADDAITRGDLDEASRLLDEAIAVDPLEEERHVRLGRALLRQGRSAAARRVADRAVALCAQLDVEPGDELARLLRDVARQG